MSQRFGSIRGRSVEPSAPWTRVPTHMALRTSSRAIQAYQAYRAYQAYQASRARIRRNQKGTLPSPVDSIVGAFAGPRDGRMKVEITGRSWANLSWLSTSGCALAA